MISVSNEHKTMLMKKLFRFLSYGINDVVSANKHNNFKIQFNKYITILTSNLNVELELSSQLKSYLVPALPS